MVFKDKCKYVLPINMRKFVNSSSFLSTTLGAMFGFASYVYTLFGATIPSFFSGYFKEIGAAIIMMAVFLFAITWLMKAKPHKKPQRYLLKIFDVYGLESTLDGVRTEFKTHDVAWSFMKEYKKSYPLFNFALVSDLPNSEKMTIFRYL
jgi:hypothetical protein